MAPGPWAIRSGSSGQGAPDLRRAAPLAGVERDPQAAGPGRLECRGVDQSGSGNAASGPARSQPVKPWSRKRAAVSASVEVRGRVVRAQRRADEADRDARSGPPPAAAPAQTAAIPSASDSPPRDVQQRTPADLDVADVVGGLGLDQLGGDPLERLGVLHQRDRQVERAQQLGLVAARHRRDERARHPGPVVGRLDPAGAGEVERGLDAQRAIEMEVQLGLRHGLDQASERRPGRGQSRWRRGSTLGVRSSDRCYEFREPCPPSSSPAPSGFVGELEPAGLARRRARVVALVRTPTAGEPRPGPAARPRRANASRSAIGDVTRPESLVGRPWPASMPSSTSSRSRATSAAARTCGWSTPRGRAAWSRR